MPPKQERLIMVLDLSKPKKDKDLDYIPNLNPNAGVKPRPKFLRKAWGKPPTITKMSGFDKAKQRLDETGKLSLEDFNNAAEIGAFIDWYNQRLKDKKEAESTRNIIEISKLLARLQTQKHIFLKSKD